MTLAVALGGPELLIILVIALLLFGGTQLPKLARSLGQAQKEFKKGIDEESGSQSGDSTSTS
jgi:sec-independent protein translocase protein TatA